MGLPEGAHRLFELQAHQAFGPRHPTLVRKISWDVLKENSSASAHHTIGDVVEFAAPGGGRFTGVLRETDEEAAVFDFNHPLAGQSIQFEVTIIGIL